eukprot:CAMPEP_0114157766 /NCGR_PEP_ID=MMETSP0043_2-20121206/26808_1 /TAXON_ID=464988 /ORGANISM="Hemiselmis andersenii, Strain CCMP644" /LENGTH=97 /DNA_ID=CAMNT_0001253379 /DNA_START=95 /DNA_END=384 /DNA_ORIENTATION=+
MPTWYSLFDLVVVAGCSANQAKAVRDALAEETLGVDPGKVLPLPEIHGTGSGGAAVSAIWCGAEALCSQGRAESPNAALSTSSILVILPSTPLCSCP